MGNRFLKFCFVCLLQPFFRFWRKSFFEKNSDYRFFSKWSHSKDNFVLYKKCVELFSPESTRKKLWAKNWRWFCDFFHFFGKIDFKNIFGLFLVKFGYKNIFQVFFKYFDEIFFQFRYLRFNIDISNLLKWVVLMNW